MSRTATAKRQRSANGYGRLVDRDGLVLREVSPDFKVSMWTQDPREAMLVHVDDVDYMIEKFGGRYVEVKEN
jgi:hypothetical protein